MRVTAFARAALLAAAMVWAWPEAGSGQTNGQPIRLIGSAMDVNSGWTSHIELDIKRWSTKEEETRLLKILEDKGQDALVNALHKNPLVGAIRVPGQLAYDLHYASLAVLPEGQRQIMAATDRYMTFAEITQRSRTVDYPFIWIQIKLNADGQGSGEMATMAKLISAGGKDVVLETYDVLKPILLKSLREEKLK